jgi:hypothetical protein
MSGGKKIITLRETNYSGQSQKHNNKLSILVYLLFFIVSPQQRKYKYQRLHSKQSGI